MGYDINKVDKYEFRGKRIKDGTWAYGSYQADVLKENKHTIIYSDYEGYYCEDEVDPKTVGQFIGLYDCEKNQIYEDDILLHDDTNWGYGGEYDRNNDGYLRTIVPSIAELLDDSFLYDAYMFKNWKVIGNIHDNPNIKVERTNDHSS